MELNLKDKVVVVTGGGRGIGEAICMAFAKEGANVVVSNRSFENAVSATEKIHALGLKATPVQTDVSRPEEARKLIERTIKEFGAIDVLVNNAGISPKNPNGEPAMTWEIGLDEWEQVMRVNLNGTLACSQEAIKFMLTRKKGAIVNVSSVAGKAPYEPMATGAHYDASKAAIINLTQRLASEVAMFGIRVNAVAPGRIATPLSKLASSKWNKAMLDRTLMGRFGTPDEIASAVVFLASDGSSFITGETLNVNGGWIMD